MHSKSRIQNSLFRTHSRVPRAARAIATMFTLTLILSQFALAQTFTVIHNFNIGWEGVYPYAGLTMDSAGNLYGTTSYSGRYDSGSYGDVYKLAFSGTRWNHTSLYTFRGGDDGGWPTARIVFGPDGNLYGTTTMGAGGVFKLTPPTHIPANALGEWTKSVLHWFAGGSDGSEPGLGDLIFDQAGNIYGTTTAGGAYGYGTVFKLTPSGGSWTETVLYSFTGGSDGSAPESGLIFDNVGNLYGTTFVGGTFGYGTVF